MSKLYIVGTPIGNLSDLSPRAVCTLSEVDFIVAEDTRVTLKLLNKFDIKKPLVSSHNYTERERSAGIIKRILDGESAAVVSDAGMPCISDPGYYLINAAREAGVSIVSVPGPSALTTAIALSGIECSEFIFISFLPKQKKDIVKKLEEMGESKKTFIFYSPPHKLLKDLELTFEILGDRVIALCRELTKVYEEAVKKPISEILNDYKNKEPRGEFVVIVMGADKETPQQFDGIKLAFDFKNKGMSIKDAAKTAAEISGMRKGDIYKALLKEDVEESEE